jgi:copper chaperone NosL
MKYSVFILSLMLMLIGCNFDVEKINIGKDQCHFCKMTIADAHYGGAILTKKGKTYKFDDMYCVRSFIVSNLIDKKEIKYVYIQDYLGNNQLLESNAAFIIQGPNINGPMNGKWIGFTSKNAYLPLDNEIHGSPVPANKFIE